MQTSHAITTPTSTYEFAAAHDARLAHVAHWARQLAIVQAVAAAFTCAGGAFPFAAMQVLFGVFLWGSAKALRAIAETRGNDVAHLRRAADKITRMFWYRSGLLVVGFATAAFGFVAQLLQ